MTLSIKNKYLFIAVPKTGSSSINRFLIDNDKSSIKNSLILDNGTIIHTQTHIGFKEIATILGVRMNEYVTFAFFRNPYEKLFSYYRYIIRPKEERKKYNLKARIVRLMSILVGFKLWALIYPYKSSVDFILDEHGDVGVKYLGRTEHLQSDFIEICKLENFDFLEPTNSMKRVRTTKPINLSHHLNAPWFKKMIDKRIKRDLDLYNQIKDKMYIRE